LPYNSSYDLTGQTVNSTFQNLLQYSTSSNLCYDGKGNQVTLSSSYAVTSSYALNGGNGGTVSINKLLIPSGSNSASFTGLSFTSIPKSILTSVNVPNSASNIYYSCADVSTITINSFTVYFNGIITNTGSYLVYMPCYS